LATSYPQMSHKLRSSGVAVTDDAVLDGRLLLRQPRQGHRVGHDAILLAAATGGKPGEHAVELGAGVGAAGLALAARVAGLRVTLVDIDPALTALAADNAERNGFAGRVTSVTLDVGASARGFAAAGLRSGSACRVLMNPPFNDAARQNTSPDAARRLAHTAPPDILPIWLRAARRLLRPRGVLSLIWRADGLADVLAALGRGFGGIAILPVHPKSGAPAVRILMRAVMESRTPLAIYPGLVLQDDQGRPAALADAVLRGKIALPFAHM
jgi:tRNA1(Val) A37 N6-methylase TrmN6